MAYSFTCVSSLITNTVELGCVDATVGFAAQTETLTLTGLTIGVDYFIRVIATGAAASNTSINVSIFSPVLNDEPTGAFSITAPSSSCSYLVGNLKSATQTTCGGIATPTCGSYGASSVDTWYSVTVPASGNLFLQTLNGSATSLGMATYTGTACSSLGLLGCSEGNPEGSISGAPSFYVTGQTPGSTVYIRVWNKNGLPSCTFSLCATTLGPCGNAATNDFCSNPSAIYTTGATNTMVATNYSVTVPGPYTTDTPGNFTSNSCTNGTVGNAWYTFVPTTSTVSIPVTTSTCGIEVELFKVDANQYGCCKTFTPVSTSFPACTGTYSFAAATSGTVAASGLTPGATYYMQVNYLTSVCSFSVTGWSYTGVLPIDMISFIGSNEGRFNVLEWVTSSEKNIDSYILERSKDGSSFEEVASLKSKGGGSASNNKYTVNDDNPFDDVTYYRIKIKHNDGSEKYSNTISINLQSKYDNIYNIHPNPTSNNLNFEYYSKSRNTLEIELINYAGASVSNLSNSVEEGKNYITLSMSELDNGAYILKVVSEKSGKTTHHKIIKN